MDKLKSNGFGFSSLFKLLVALELVFMYSCCVFNLWVMCWWFVVVSLMYFDV